MSYNRESLLSGGRPIQVLRYLSEQKSYSKVISEELDIDQSLCSEILSLLNDVGLAEKAKRTKAQYYRITDQGEKFLSLDDRIKEKEKELERSIEKLELEKKEIVED